MTLEDGAGAERRISAVFFISRTSGRVKVNIAGREGRETEGERGRGGVVRNRGEERGKAGSGGAALYRGDLIREDGTDHLLVEEKSIGGGRWSSIALVLREASRFELDSVAGSFSSHVFFWLFEKVEKKKDGKRIKGLFI